jgi:hypothetical protein
MITHLHTNTFLSEVTARIGFNRSEFIDTKLIILIVNLYKILITIQTKAVICTDYASFLLHIKIKLWNYESFRYYRWPTDRTAGVRFPVEERDFSILHSIQADSGLHQTSGPVDIEGSLAGGKVDRA